MSMSKILNELQDIPIRDFKSDNKQNFEKVVRPKEEADTNIRFSVNDYKLKHGRISASSDKKLELSIDKFLSSYKNMMGTVYNYSASGDETKTAYVVFYDRKVSHLDEKYKNALTKKMDEFAKEHSKEIVKPTEDVKSLKSNIQKALETLSDKSLKDVHTYIKAVQERDKYAD